MSNDPHHITNAEAIALTARWRSHHPTAFRGGLFDRIAFENLLAKLGCEGIRIYMGEKEDGSWTLVMVATDAQRKDIFHRPGKPISSSEGDPSGDDTEEDPLPCPQWCDCDSPLSDCPPPP